MMNICDFRTSGKPPQASMGSPLTIDPRTDGEKQLGHAIGGKHVVGEVNLLHQGGRRRRSLNERNSKTSLDHSNQQFRVTRYINKQMHVYIYIYITSVHIQNDTERTYII